MPRRLSRDEAIESVAHMLARALAESLAMLVDQAPPAVPPAAPAVVPYYATGHGGTLPLGTKHAWCVRNFRTMPGARKVGRNWTISVADFDAFVASRNRARTSLHAVTCAVLPANDRALARRDLEAAGIRLARR